MHSSSSICPVSPTFLRSDSTQLVQNKDTFHQIFQRTLNNRSSSRPPKTELTGILVPYGRPAKDLRCKFKLQTDSEEYPLTMKDALALIAKKIEWEEVTVKGTFDLGENLFEVEKISLAKTGEPYRLSVPPVEPYFELEQYRRTITQQGKLDLAPDFLAS